MVDTLCKTAFGSERLPYAVQKVHSDMLYFPFERVTTVVSSSGLDNVIRNAADGEGILSSGTKLRMMDVTPAPYTLAKRLASAQHQYASVNSNNLLYTLYRYISASFENNQHERLVVYFPNEKLASFFAAAVNSMRRVDDPNFEAITRGTPPPKIFPDFCEPEDKAKEAKMIEDFDYERYIRSNKERVPEFAVFWTNNSRAASRNKTQSEFLKPQDKRVSHFAVFTAHLLPPDFVDKAGVTKIVHVGLPHRGFYEYLDRVLPIIEPAPEALFKPALSVKERESLMLVSPMEESLLSYVTAAPDLSKQGASDAAAPVVDLVDMKPRNLIMELSGKIANLEAASLVREIHVRGLNLVDDVTATLGFSGWLFHYSKLCKTRSQRVALAAEAWAFARSIGFRRIPRIPNVWLQDMSLHNIPGFFDFHATDLKIVPGARSGDLAWIDPDAVAADPSEYYAFSLSSPSTIEDSQAAAVSDSKPTSAASLAGRGAAGRALGAFAQGAGR
jgi:hypothetical protein